MDGLDRSCQYLAGAVDGELAGRRDRVAEQPGTERSPKPDHAGVSEFDLRVSACVGSTIDTGTNGAAAVVVGRDRDVSATGSEAVQSPAWTHRFQ